MSDAKPIPMEVTLTVRAVACVYPGREANTMHWQIADCTVLVSEDDGAEIGRVSGSIGGGMEISDKRPEAGSVTYFIRADEFWNAYEHAIKKGAVSSGPAPPTTTPEKRCDVTDLDGFPCDAKTPCNLHPSPEAKKPRLADSMGSSGYLTVIPETKK